MLLFCLVLTHYCGRIHFTYLASSFVNFGLICRKPHCLQSIACFAFVLLGAAHRHFLCRRHPGVYTVFWRPCQSPWWSRRLLKSGIPTKSTTAKRLGASPAGQELIFAIRSRATWTISAGGGEGVVLRGSSAYSNRVYETTNTHAHWYPHPYPDQALPSPTIDL